MFECGDEKEPCLVLSWAMAWACVMFGELVHVVHKRG